MLMLLDEDFLDRSQGEKWPLPAECFQRPLAGVDDDPAKSFGRKGRRR
jgi:hypothetical protein